MGYTANAMTMANGIETQLITTVGIKGFWNIESSSLVRRMIIDFAFA